MALEKVSVLAVGPGNIRSNNATSRVFSSNIQMDNWSAITNYNISDCVEYSGDVWRAVTVNLNETPSSSNPNWILLYSGVHDGDIAISVTGTIDIRQRVSGVWLSVSQRPLTVTLLDNQPVPVEIFRYSAASFKDSFLEYDISRGNGNTEGGSLRILTDGTSTLNYSQEFTWLIGDPQTTLIPSINAGDVIISYISSSQSSPITFKYSLRAW
jgi:hypothetical protein